MCQADPRRRVPTSGIYIQICAGTGVGAVVRPRANGRLSWWQWVCRLSAILVCLASTGCASQQSAALLRSPSPTLTSSPSSSPEGACKYLPAGTRCIDDLGTPGFQVGQSPARTSSSSTVLVYAAASPTGGARPCDPSKYSWSRKGDAVNVRGYVTRQAKVTMVVRSMVPVETFSFGQIPTGGFAVKLPSTTVLADGRHSLLIEANANESCVVPER